MKKLRLSLDELAVESFSPAPPPRLRGTARAHADTELPYTQCYDTCDFQVCGGTLDTACGCQFTNVVSCYTDCTDDDYTCGAYETCRYPCQLSVMTNCHRCV